MIYQPAEDSYLLQEAAKKHSKGRSFLDMGSGSGIQSETAKESKAKSILAADINPESVALLEKKGFQAVKSDLFSNIEGKFDLIAFNPPYLPEDKREDEESQLVTTGGKRGDEIILKFLKQAPEHLNKNGVILLVVSSLTPQNKINNLLKEKNLNKSLISSKKLFLETLEVWKLSK